MIFTRYPDVAEVVPFEQYDKTTAEEKVSVAKKVFHLLKPRYKMLEEKEDG
ncbi:MAG: hypothetical protein QME54_06270 [Actinomycetota bacterium]|nr:hypothetical protein [Actinomycetota bacterium]